MSSVILKAEALKTQLSQYNNSGYHPGPKWKIALWMLVSFFFFSNSLSVFYGFKCWLLRLFGASVGKGVIIKPGVRVKFPWFLTIGDHVWIGEDAWIDNLAKVSIGNNVCISQCAYILTGNHNYTSATFDLMIANVVLEDGVWIGAKSTVCPGVVCKSHSILTVGSVASKDLEDFCVYQGVPAEKIKIRKFR